MTAALTMLAGAAGSGKSTLAARLWSPSQVFARDWARLAVGDRPDDVSSAVRADADEVLETIARLRLRRGLATVIDSTGASVCRLQRFCDLGRAYGAWCELLIVDTPLPVCLARQVHRPRLEQVPAVDVRGQHAIVGALISRYATGDPAPWDAVRIVSGSPELAGGAS